MSKVFEDDRGFFAEVYNQSKGVEQVNVSYSKQGVVRGLHYQEPEVTKKVWVLTGRLYEVAYNLKTGEVKANILTPNSGVFICPKGWAHGNQALENTVFAYSMDGVYNPDGDKGLNPSIINWPINNYIASEKDKDAPTEVKQ